MSIETLPDATWATSIPRERIPAALGHLAALSQQLSARWLESADSDPSTRERAPSPPEWSLSLADLVVRTGKSRRWIFKNAKELPFVKRITKKTLIGDETRLRRWIDRR